MKRNRINLLSITAKGKCKTNVNSREEGRRVNRMNTKLILLVDGVNIQNWKKTGPPAGINKF